MSSAQQVEPKRHAVESETTVPSAEAPTSPRRISLHSNPFAQPDIMVEITIRKRPREDAAVTQRKFFKKTARGKVIKGACSLLARFRSCPLTSVVLRERYLRDDVSCGIQHCSLCESSLEATLPPSGALDHRTFTFGHYVVPDTNIFLAQVRELSYAQVCLLKFCTCADGSYRIPIIHDPHYSPANRHGRSPP